jgi:glucosylceramidase
MKKITLVALAMFIGSCSPKMSPSTVNDAKPFSTEGKSIAVYTTADSSNFRLSLTDNVQFRELRQPLETQICVFVDPTKTFQTFMGIGAALTDASAETYAKMSKTQQKSFLEAYFDVNKGIGYTLARTNIHSCDFSSDTYTYIKEGDSELKSFNIDHDRKYRLPFIKQTIAAAGGTLRMYVSPWSPPAFMKDNNNILKGGRLKPEFYQSWANYFAKFIKTYEKEGVPIWGLTVQNEPMATQRWESCVFSAEEERDFLKTALGPILQKEKLGDKKIIVWDHNRDLINQRANTIFNDPEASKYAWGMGFHWYETWAGGTPMFENVGHVNRAFPDKNLMFTEGCNENFDAKKYQFWANGERYGRSMINDFNNGTVAWTDWNILLDETGGPNHVENFCFAPIHFDTKKKEIVYTPSYYYIGHFSKFIRLGAKRVISAASRSQLLTTSFINEDGKMAVIVMNQSDKKVTYNLCVGTKAAEVTILPHAIQTLNF